MTHDSDHGCKVCRVLDEHGLADLNSRLVAQWKGDDVERKGYRKLATWLNVMLLRQAMDRAGIPTLGDEARSKYMRLQGKDGTTASEVREVLASEGIGIEQLERDFVSYGVIRTHLTECLEAEREQTEGEWELRAIEITREHSRNKVLNSVQSLLNKNRLQTGEEIDVHVDIRIECEECHTRMPLDRALRRGEVCQCGAAEQEVA